MPGPSFTTISSGQFTILASVDNCTDIRFYHNLTHGDQTFRLITIVPLFTTLNWPSLSAPSPVCPLSCGSQLYPTPNPPFYGLSRDHGLVLSHMFTMRPAARETWVQWAGFSGEEVNIQIFRPQRHLQVSIAHDRQPNLG